MPPRHVETDTSRPLAISENKRVTLPFIMLCGLLAITASAAIAYNRIETKTEDHEERLKRVETKTEDIAVMKNDLQWIRRAMEEDRQTRGALVTKRP